VVVAKEVNTYLQETFCICIIKALDFFCLSPQQAAGYYDKKFAAQTAESLKTVAPQAAGN
jgi:hypothetical protein